MPAERYIVAPNGTRYDRQTGWAEYQNESGEWVRFSDNQTGDNSRRDRRLFGSSGYLGDGWDNWAQTPEAWESQMQGRNKDLFNKVEGEHAGDTPTKYVTYELKPEVKERLGDRVQINQLGQGGYHEVIDPSKVEWDDEFGYVTTADNIAKPDEKQTGIGPWLPYILAAAAVPMIAGHAAATGGAIAASEGVGLVEGVTGAGGTNLGTYGGMTTGLDGGLVNTVASTGVNAAAGTIPTAAANAGWSIPGWNALSSGAQRVILSGLSTGASAMINTRNAERAIDAANSRQQDQQDFETETRERRGRPPAAVAPVRARPIPGGFAASGGLADKYMTPRGG